MTYKYVVSNPSPIDQRVEGWYPDCCLFLSAAKCHASCNGGPETVQFWKYRGAQRLRMPNMHCTEHTLSLTTHSLLTPTPLSHTHTLLSLSPSLAHRGHPCLACACPYRPSADARPIYFWTFFLFFAQTNNFDSPIEKFSQKLKNSTIWYKYFPNSAFSEKIPLVFLLLFSSFLIPFLRAKYHTQCLNNNPHFSSIS